MSSGFTKTTIIECPRSQSDEGIANNNTKPSQWSNRLGDGLHLKPGDQISVHSSYVSEIGAESGQIQIKGQSLNASVEVRITDFERLEYDPELPQKYALINCSNKVQKIDIRDDTLNLVVSPYKSANGEYYLFLPRRWSASGASIFWTSNERRDGGSLAVAGYDIGQTQYPPAVLDRCAADLSTKYWAYRTGKGHSNYRVTGKNDGSRFTLFTRTQTYYAPTDNDEHLPPTTANSDYSAEECEGFRDPAVFGDYIQVRNLISLTANPGYNSPSDLSVQLTEEMNERNDFQKFTYNTSNSSNTVHRRETFSFKTESPAYKMYNCATATQFEKSNYAEWEKTDGSWDTGQVNQYLSCYQHIGIKRPGLYVAGKLLNASGGYLTDENTNNISSDEVFITGIEWNDENILKFKEFFDTQVLYPELFEEYKQSGSDVSVDYNRFIHMNLQDDGPNRPLDENNPSNFANLRSYKAGWLGYDLYDATLGASQCSFPMFIDYNPATADYLPRDVQETYWGDAFQSNSGQFTADYNQLAYGFARKVKREGFTAGMAPQYFIGFQFTKTNDQIPDIFFQVNTAQASQQQIGTAGGRRFGFDYHFTAYGTSVIMLTNGNVNIFGSTFTNSEGHSVWDKEYRFSQATGERIYNLDKYQFGQYVGADSPLINYDTDQQRFQISSLHTAEVIGNLVRAGYNGNGTTTPTNPNAGDKCYKLNKRPLLTNYTPELTPYIDEFSAAPAGASSNTYISQNVAIDPYSIMDAQSGLFIEDWIVPEHLWDESLVGIMGFRYDQFHNEDSTSSRQVRIKAHGANADLHNVNIITTNADVNEGDLIEYQQNTTDAAMYSPCIPVGLEPGGLNYTAAKIGRYITPAITISPVSSINITAERLPTKTLRPYYTIRSDIIEENHALGGLTSGITLPIVAITNKANPFGDFLNGFAGEITFTNTIDRVLTRIRCSIHEPDGSAARCDHNSAVIFKIDQQVPAQLDLVSQLLESKKKSDQLVAQELDDPDLEFKNVKYSKDLFQ